jgi:hypothetical protein
MSDFATRVTTLVDAEAPPVDIEELVRRLGWHIDHYLTGGDELLRQEMPEPGGGFDRPHPAVTIHRLCPVDELCCLVLVCSDRDLTNHDLRTVDSDRCVGRLVRVDTNRRDHHQPPR